MEPTIVTPARNRTVAALKKLFRTAPETPGQRVECVFSLNPQKRKQLLFDLKLILRLPDARIALPNIGSLDDTIRRNHERIRIPYVSMLPLVRELLSVRHRVNARSPLIEIMSAIPGLVNTVLTAPVAASAVLEGRVNGSGRPVIASAEQDAEIARILALIKGRPSPARAAPSHA